MHVDRIKKSRLTLLQELIETFQRVTTMLEAALAESTTQTQAERQKQKQTTEKMPPTSHTLMDLIITLSIYLPRSSFPTLFSLAALILPQTADAQLQKKAYKLLPRLATSQTGLVALQERNSELQQLLLSSASSASAPARRDRLAAIAVVIEHLPQTSLYFIPSILSEVVISAKEVNEKARTAAFDLLVLMGQKMQTGGTIAQSQIPHMPADAPNAEASLEEFFTMVSAGLAGSTPHMISASITALTRILYEFRNQLPDAVIEDLVSTMDLFLTSNNREIVRSVLGFVKVAVISLADNVIRPRLETLVPGLMGWSKEHKAHFRAKVKHIFERMIRRFGVQIVEKWCPEQDKKLIHNIRKTRDRRKRKKEGGNGEEDDEAEPTTGKPKRKGKFESEFDEAVYGSDEDDDESDNGGTALDNNDDEAPSRSRKGGGSKTYIVEDSDEPLDLLDRKALGNISSTKPVKFKKLPGVVDGKKFANKAKIDLDGKLVFNDADDQEDGDGDGEDAMMLDFDANGSASKASKHKNKTGLQGNDPNLLEGGINAYVDAIKGRDAVQRGRGGRLKFSNRRDKDAGRGAGEDEMDVDALEVGSGKGRGRVGGGRGSGNGSASFNNKEGFKAQRKGLGIGKVSGGRVGKSFRGGNGRGRGRGRDGGRGGRR